MKLEWSAVALADLDRFAAFLRDHHPHMADIVAREILAKAQLLEAHPELGYAIGADGAIASSCLKCCGRNMFFATVLQGIVS